MPGEFDETDRPVIYVDSDGCLMDLDARIAELYHAVRGVSMAPTDVRNRATWSDIDCLLVLPGVFQNMRPLPGAAEALPKMRALADVRVATSFSRNPDSSSDKLIQLRDTLGIPIKHVIPIKEKWRLASTGPRVALVEDTLANGLAFARKNPNAFVGVFVYPNAAEEARLHDGVHKALLPDNVQLVYVLEGDITARGTWDLTRAWHSMVARLQAHFENLDF